MADRPIRVRYAPSPTGHLHIGNARTALFNYLFARHNNGTMVLRIEDTDTKRNIEDGEKSQIDNLHWLGIDWDEGPDKPGEFGPYRQSERKDIYLPLIQQLVDEGKAYESYKTEEELQADREAQQERGEMPHYEYEYAGMTEEEKAAKIADAKAKGLTPVIRFHIPEDKVYEWNDIVKGDISIEAKTIGGDFVILKRDGMPTYNFAVVVDDHMMQISHVLRGDDHIANTPKQLAVYDAFGWEAPTFGHMTLIINGDTGKKLSKRDESVLQFIEQYRELGYLPEAMFNFITLLGWSPKGESEIFSKKEFIDQFDPKRLSKSPARFDNKKLEWVNNQYVKKADPNELMSLSLANLVQDGLLPADPDAMTVEWARQLISLYTDHMSYTAQISKLADIFFIEPGDLDEDELKELADPSAPQVLEAFADKIKALDNFTAYSINQIVNDVKTETGVKGRKLYMPIRIAATRQMHGPQLAETIELMGRKKTLANINFVLDAIKA
ncbi:glutamate--tRNA ligase [Lacticaseibacillus saniviri]|uniref:Glutamate--tRNA ligase n=1 Tax=Lacticaseibacillus saniviri JCM 17471 = DSM 24301 TaxID=1293598 RepID=A0A0R2N2T3_9LACO|nr:glutamate--tRNA ligase [Lacticaseibacillus saniviri]KRO18051.1 Glutamyl- and glutaminyl-tRNA synthetase [Lacticaseibacillus saniviri JCM 17471 = DSM 24301]MCG4281898.1 glutamate--tRNA ligase [Lacticaseibacillus saniviri]